MITADELVTEWDAFVDWLLHQPDELLERISRIQVELVEMGVRFRRSPVYRAKAWRELGELEVLCGLRHWLAAIDATNRFLASHWRLRAREDVVQFVLALPNELWEVLPDLVSAMHARDRRTGSKTSWRSRSRRFQLLAQELHVTLPCCPRDLACAFHELSVTH